MPAAPAPLPLAFIQLCLRSRFEPQALAAARELARREGFDWGEVYRLARQHVVAPLIYAALRDEPGVPAGVRQKLRSAYVYTGRRNRALFDELAQALPAVQSAGVSALVLKGGALANTAYGDPALRPLRDLDLLVQRERLPDALLALEPLGYAPLNAELSGDAVIAYEGEVALRKSDIVEIILELHWNLIEARPGDGRPTVPAHWFWETAVPLELGAAHGRALGPEAQIVYLCAHAWAHHSGGGLLWLHDIAQALHHDRERIAWTTAVEFILQHDLALEVGQVLSQVVEGWGPLVPGQVMAQLRPAATVDLEARARTRRAPGQPGAFRRAWAGQSGEPGWGGRARLAWRLAFPPAAYMLRRYHPKYGMFLPFYYPVRWLEGLLPLFQRVVNRLIR